MNVLGQSILAQVLHQFGGEFGETSTSLQNGSIVLEHTPLFGVLSFLCLDLLGKSSALGVASSHQARIERPKGH